MAALLLGGEGCERRAALGESAGAAAPSRPIARVYPAATSVRMFVRSDVHVEKPEEHFETRWLNPPEGFVLSADQQRRLRAALRDTPPPEAMAACFVPHHFFRFYDTAGRQLGEIAVCFCCGGVRASPRLVADDRWLGANHHQIATIVTELGASTKTDCGE